MSADPQKVKSIFLAAAEKPAAERAAYLDAACRDDALLRHRVEQLLAAHDCGGSSLEPRGEGASGVHTRAEEADASASAGTRIGPYKLLQEIGEGGMGTVWMAEQTEPVKRMVALKLIKAGMDSAQIMARFEAERQALALMEHPNIARVLDAGTTSSGLPYFVMELVKGIPITKYCDDQQVTTRERLELFVPVCQAIQHAHQKGIIHRDIKPSNVLVATYDGKPVPKVIDFGVAKATGQKLTDRTLFTGFGVMVGTLEYMSPEQAQFNALDIDTRSDIYGLGVLLYELLTGTTPLTRHRLKRAALEEALRIIREEEPPKPSTRLSESRDSLPSLAAQRNTEPAKLTKLMRGDLDWLVMKALEKDRDRRYETANGFALDILRYLHDEPVLASPPSSLYRLRKFTKRNKGILAAGLLLLLALTGGMIGTMIGLLQARQQQQLAEQQRDRAFKSEDAADEARKQESRQRKLAESERDRATTEEQRAKENEQIAKNQEQKALKSAEELRAVLGFFQQQVLAAARPAGQGGGLGIATTIRQAVDAAEPKVAEAFANNPVVEASIRDVLGMTYWYLGEANRAIMQHERALQLRTAKLGLEHPSTLSSMHNLAAAYQDAGRVTDALPLFEETLTRRKAKLGLDHPNTLTTMNDLALAYKAAGRLHDALPLLEQTMKLQRAKLGPEHPNTLICMGNLASAYRTAGRLNDALPLYEEALKLSKLKLGPEHPNTLINMSNLASAYQAVDRLNDALSLLEEALRLQKAKLGPEHPDTLRVMINLAAAYKAAGRLNDALPLYEETLKLLKAQIGPHHPDTLTSMNSLAVAYRAADRLNDALPLFEETLKLRKSKLGPEHPDTLTSMNNLAAVYRDTGRLNDALPLFEETLTLRKSKLGPEHPDTLTSMNNLAAAYLAAKQPAPAEPLLREYLAIANKKQADRWETFNARSRLGGALLGQNKYADAEALLLQGYEGMKRREKQIPPEGWPRVIEALERLVVLYEATGQEDNIVKWRTELEAAKAKGKEQKK